MAALCAGDQYGLSSKGSFNENKVLIFVKLTDSAHRAIEEYLRNENKINQNPTIKFLGNEGQLSFPSYSNNGNASFNFSLSSTADMEGPGGSFECIQHMGPSRNDLEVLGPMSRKMRIHANDDVYEATRHRMAVVEENQKNKCTRVIKPNQTDIGRKVKVKQTINRLSNVLPKRDSSSLVTGSSPSMAISKSANTTSFQPSFRPSLNNGITSKSPGSNCVTSTRPPAKPSTTNSIMKRPLKERLIHLLALQPFKKPELHQRLTKEGLKDQERQCIGNILKQIAIMRENTYNLKRPIWNDVNDDWPFYTEQERQLLKRRKPQNLTPPGSSDGGSSGSGQSPTSTHPGSPPPPISSSSTSSANKRPGYYDGADGLPTKRQRISHYRKPPNPLEIMMISVTPTTNSSNSSGSSPLSQSRRSLTLDSTNNVNSRSRESAVASYLQSTANNGYGPPPMYMDSNNSNSNNKRHFSDEDNDDSNKKRDSHSLSFALNREKTFLINKGNNSNHNSSSNHLVSSSPSSKITPSSMSTTSSSMSNVASSALMIDERNDGVQKDYDTATTKILNRNNRLEERDREREQREREREQARWSKVTSTTHNGEILPARVSPDSQTDPKEPSSRELPIDNRDYFTKYTAIKDVEQRRKYKADFNADYSEYRELHAMVEKVSRRFAQLEERLKQEGSPSSPGYKEIKKQILKEYLENKQDVKYQKLKKRFQYLHEKLAYIKRLVAEYDERQAGGGGSKVSSETIQFY